jgi:hypothetical protein
MAFFPKTDPLDAAVKKQHNHEKQLRLAEVKFSECLKAVKQARDANDDAKLDIALANKRAAEDKVAALTEWLTDDRKDVTDLQAQADKIADEQTRAATAGETDAMKTEIKTVGHEAIVAITKLANVAERAGMCVPEARGLHTYCTSSATQIPDAVALIVKLLGDHAAAVTAGTAPATLKKPEAPIKPTIAAKAPIVHLFAMRPVKWIGADGNQTVAQKFSDVYLTPSAAKRALELKAVVQINDPLRRQHLNTYGGHADPALALDLDNIVSELKQAEPITHSAFEPAVVGPARILKIAREG